MTDTATTTREIVHPTDAELRAPTDIDTPPTGVDVTTDAPAEPPGTGPKGDVTKLPTRVARGAKGPPEKPAPGAKQTKALPATVDPKIASQKAKREAAKPLPSVLTGPTDTVSPPAAAAPPAKAPKAPVNGQTRFHVIRFIARESKLTPGARVTWNDTTAGDRFNGEKNRARFRKGVASGLKTVGELLKLQDGPTSGDLRHWAEHSSTADGAAWIDIDGMKYLAPRGK